MKGLVVVLSLPGLVVLRSAASMPWLLVALRWASRVWKRFPCGMRFLLFLVSLHAFPPNLLPKRSHTHTHTHIAVFGVSIVCGRPRVQTLGPTVEVALSSGGMEG